MKKLFDNLYPKEKELKSEDTKNYFNHQNN